MAPHAQRSFPRPTRRAASALVAVALVVVALQLGAVVAAACVLGVAAVVLADALRVRAVVPELVVASPRTLARRARAPFSIRVVGAPHVALLRQPRVPELAVEPATARGGELVATIRGLHRGRHALPGPAARLVGGLGLASVDWTWSDPCVVQVLPDLPSARALAAHRRGAGQEGAPVARLGIGTEFESIRDYVDGDDVRTVNWLATSRAGRPMTNRYRVDEHRDVLFLLDAGRLMVAPVGDSTRLDVALDALCALGVAADDGGDRVGAVAFGGGLLRVVEPRRRGTDAVVRALFDLQPETEDSDFLYAFRHAARRKRSIVVVLTDLVDEGASRTLLEALPVLARRHAVLLASCRDADLESVAYSAPADYADVARSAVALRLLDAHADTVRRATALGATVVEARPGALGAACVAAYAGVKARARA